MRSEGFFKEWRRAASFIGPIALINPLILTVYVLFWHRGDLMRFWTFGIAINCAICMFAVFVTFAGVVLDRWRRLRLRKQQRRQVSRSRMWRRAENYRSVQEALEASERMARVLATSPRFATPLIWTPEAADPAESSGNSLPAATADPHAGKDSLALSRSSPS